jgi:hypothetical protein
MTTGVDCSIVWVGAAVMNVMSGLDGLDLASNTFSGLEKGGTEVVTRGERVIESAVHERRRDWTWDASARRPDTGQFFQSPAESESGPRLEACGGPRQTGTD